MEKKHGLLLLCLCTLLGCNGNTKTAREIAEENGTVLLMQARNAYNTGDYQTAVILIDSIRSTYPLAMEVREQGILLKDSVYLEEARYLHREVGLLQDKRQAVREDTQKGQIGSAHV